ncbi:Two-component response regulator, AmiR/NasT family, consists of REC and RNA-binding antiterminator (ANTAR) domains [Poseidonocella pacifica]|uniref:Two-component response regulator, AmiR/NasT family, consists of REC and RNA-binding antiterminator (ANTAR) domains n=1 Tax=Poseidonocella pacifica TaxID=871651 RepID=A0A1I0YVA9_9RHOB|nr:ANTAR domain-containing protein [Poseidonocella pacifica]SFB17274.1 Two-component response regulator, AmiR/NasT family, consists of REC and RNA-binding antiterminator (ANTAR) domains [Poseidonocella pacifica]
MSGAMLKNFRGLRALVIMAPDSGRDTLERTLIKLGLEVSISDVPPCLADPPPAFDVVFFDADDGADLGMDSLAMPDLPLIAVIGSEAPSRLARVIRHRAASHILKPVRSSGIFTALLLAMNEHAARARHQQELLALRRRLSGRRVVMKAVVQLITVCGLSEEDAYQWLRREAMERRIPMEDMARHALGEGPEMGPQEKSRIKTGITGGRLDQTDQATVERNE